jgi:hypothetical protein
LLISIDVFVGAIAALLHMEGLKNDPDPALFTLPDAEFCESGKLLLLRDGDGDEEFAEIIGLMSSICTTWRPRDCCCRP